MSKSAEKRVSDLCACWQIHIISEPDTEKETEDDIFDDDISGDETDEEIIIDDPASTIHIEWSDDYKNACKLFYKKILRMMKSRKLCNCLDPKLIKEISLPCMIYYTTSVYTDRSIAYSMFAENLDYNKCEKT